MIVVRLGVLLAVLGFGSAILHYTDIQFRLLMWSEPMQPLLGAGIGVVGVVVAVIPYLRNRSSSADPAVAYPPQPGQPYPQPPQQFGQQPYGAAAQPFQQQGQFPPPHPAAPAPPQQFAPQPGYPPPGAAPAGPPPYGPQGGQSFGPHR
jgi:hypothetical protein